MELKGKIIQKMPLATGEGKNGTWKKQEYVIEIPNGNYAPKKVCFSIWGDKIDQFAIHEQEELSVSFDLESREYNGRWYTDVRAWKVSRQIQINQILHHTKIIYLNIRRNQRTILTRQK
jgi:hypothetical protein